MISFTIFVLSPIADIAITIKNLDNVLSGENTSADTPSEVAIVVMTEAITKNIIKNGNIFLIEKLFPAALFSFLALYTAKTRVIGIIASVRVSLTMVALSNVFAPGCIPSHAEAAAVTEDVSFTAVPAKSPNPSLLIPTSEPKVGNISAAKILNKNITEIDCAISSSLAPITGAVAAIAEPPQIDEPTPISVEILDGVFISL